MSTSVHEFSALALSHSDMQQLVLKNQLSDGVFGQSTNPPSRFIAVERFNPFMARIGSDGRSFQGRDYLFIEVDRLPISLLLVPQKADNPCC